MAAASIGPVSDKLRRRCVLRFCRRTTRQAGHSPRLCLRCCITVWRRALSASSEAMAAKSCATRRSSVSGYLVRWCHCGKEKRRELKERPVDQQAPAVVTARPPQPRSSAWYYLTALGIVVLFVGGLLVISNLAEWRQSVTQRQRKEWGCQTKPEAVLMQVTCV